ncbi:hypothetical protein GCM10022251_51320 [Phytohabitans flavus]|uniref:Uncharacterized protein n=1 Tax=Phytohabitans flavus TaxID=1076124 RepID=A0A6F8Y6X4_9ACTN|nr:hypothetical protein [Phytohabitans flavus]BCB81866.1 hypothetical protein Pflav_082760 [Phytohabitans flavus]
MANRQTYDADRDRGAAEDVTDRVPGDTLDERGTFEDPVLAGERNDPDDLTAVTPSETEYAEPGPQRTGLSAPTVGGAVAAAAEAGPYQQVRDRTDTEPQGAVDDHASGTPSKTDRDADRDRREGLDAERTDLDADRAAEERVYADAANRTETTAAPDEQHVSIHSDRLPEAAPAVDAPAEAAVAPAVEEPITGLWGAETVQGYRERWREVQFRFVDDPASAAREATQLVDEAVGALTAELNRQKEALGGRSGEDTEDLRAAVRRHRDFLDRLLGL